MSRPPKGYFDDLARAYQEARGELAGRGFTRFVMMAALPDVEWPNGWWDCRGFVLQMRDPFGNLATVERTLVARDYRLRRRRTRNHPSG